jgi:hypothetical protein
METNLMSNERKLELTLFGMMPHKVTVQWMSQIDTLQRQILTMGNYYYNVVTNQAKPELHSIEKLSENILDDENDYFYQLNLELCDILSVTDCSYFLKSISENKYYAVSANVMFTAIEWFKENHFNIYLLPKDMYIEKSEVKKCVEK